MKKTSKIAREWLDKKAEHFLQDLGLGKGQKVLDFGCGEGRYTIPAAYVVGDRGTIFAMDREGDYVTKTIWKARRLSLENIVGIIPSGERTVPLSSNNVNAVILFDTFHGGYFPERKDRELILKGLFRVLRKKGMLHVYPTHLKSHGMTFRGLVGEIEQNGFHLVKERSRKLLHGDTLVRGRIFTFRKSLTGNGSLS